MNTNKSGIDKGNNLQFKFGSSRIKYFFLK